MPSLYEKRGIRATLGVYHPVGIRALPQHALTLTGGTPRSDSRREGSGD